jgi:hypothetical protein
MDMWLIHIRVSLKKTGMRGLESTMRTLVCLVFDIKIISGVWAF